MGEEKFPGFGGVGRSVIAEQSTDLFTALLKTGADDRFYGGGENIGGGPAHEIDEIGIDIGARVEAAGADFVPGSGLVGGLEEN